jgi:hypothetical protein
LRECFAETGLSNRPFSLSEDELAFAICLANDGKENEPECCGRYPTAMGCDLLPTGCTGFGYPANPEVPASVVSACEA